MRRRLYLILPAVLFAACLLAPYLAPYDPNKADPAVKFAKISAEHWLGTDYLGRDIFSRILWGGRRTIGYAALVTAVSAAFGLCLGMLSGFAGGAFDGVVMKGSDILRSFPGVVLVLLVVSIRGVGIGSVCVAMLFTRWIWHARMARNLTRAEMGRTSIMAARMAGSSFIKILRRHIFVSILPEMLPVLSIDFGSTLLAISGYSFLGLGILPPDAEWGMMINDGRNYMEHPGMMFWPGLCVIVIVISVNVLGDRIRDRLEARRS